MIGDRDLGFFDPDGADWPLLEPIVPYGSIITFLSQVEATRRGNDIKFLESLSLDTCFYGACDIPIHTFICDLAPERDLPEARDIVAAVKARNFRSQHITSLDATYIPFPGYRPYTENDEIHNDCKEQYVFSHKDGVDAPESAHSELKRYVVDQRLWYVVLHSIARRVTSQWGDFRSSEYVVLFALGRSPCADRLIGVVTEQLCHNLCD